MARSSVCGGNDRVFEPQNGTIAVSFTTLFPSWSHCACRIGNSEVGLIVSTKGFPVTVE